MNNGALLALCAMQRGLSSTAICPWFPVSVVWWLLNNNYKIGSWQLWDFGGLEWVLSTYIRKSLNQRFLLRKSFLSHKPRVVRDQSSSSILTAPVPGAGTPSLGCSGHRGHWRICVDYFKAESSSWFSRVRNPSCGSASLGWVCKTSLDVCPSRSWAGSGRNFPFALFTLLIKPQLVSVSG